jgi:hypothetical protein
MKIPSLIGRLGILIAVALGACNLSTANEALAQLSTQVPPGAWKAARLRNLPEGATIAVSAESDGQLDVILADRETLAGAEPSRPLFRGRFDKRLSFSVVIPASGDYYLVFDNRRSSIQREITASIHGSYEGRKARPPEPSEGPAQESQPKLRL